ncbi:MAG: membrane protein [Rhodospirillaceae bacterium BRH_c57]|nr:MAG: membrane protein [Rhodospirillaceae bacterium BRH_c57]
MSPIATIAGKEIREGLRNRWVAAATLLLALLALALAFIGAAPTGDVAAGRLAVTVVSLASLAIYLLPLIALLLAFDAIVGEAEQGTLLLLLAHPISRWQVLAGKFVGQAAILAFATIVGFGLAAVAVSLVQAPSAGEWRAFAGLVGASVLLGWSFIAIGHLVSVLVAERTTAAGAAVAVWLLMVVLYDMGLLGVLVATGGQGIIGDILPALLMLNPADAYRLVTLTSFEAAADVAGFGAVSEGISPFAALAALVAWIAVPLGIAGLVFTRREI